MDEGPQFGVPSTMDPIVICQIEGSEKQRESQSVANKVLELLFVDRRESVNTNYNSIG